ERALAGIWLADQADIGNDLQLQNKLAFLPIAAGRGVTRGAIRCALEMRVSLAGSAAASSDDAIAVVRQVFQRKAALGIIHKRARRDFDSQVLGATALLVGAAAGSAARGAPKAMMSQRGQIVHATF